jgi:hypothetical protein
VVRVIASDLFRWPPTEHSLAVWATVVIVVGGAFAVARFGGRLWHSIMKKVERRLTARPPRDTMRVVPQPSQIRWNDGSVAGRPAMQLTGTWLVTNAMPRTNLILARVRLRLPLLRRLRLDTDQSQLESPITLEVPWGTADDLHALFWVVPRLAKQGRPFRATLLLTDQFENTRRVKASFTAPRILPQRPEPTREQLSAIEDPIEKDVAAVLQAELARYRTNGRREGGFGSVTITYNGQTLRGGGDFREVGSPRNQVIVSDPEHASVESDNAEALLTLYARLDTDEERTRFRSALLQRVSRDSAYAPIAYLPMLVALDLDFAPEFFAVAREKLLGDSAYGFSNCLMLLDSILRLQHSDVSDELLDQTENFIHGADEHPFAIPERVAAIRAYRLRG